MRGRTDNKNGYNKNTSYKESSINSIRSIEPLIKNYLELYFKLVVILVSTSVISKQMIGFATSLSIS